jgi:methyl-accepting chemotaxis protein
MLKFSNIRIGTKLAIMSGISVVLVALIVAAQMWGNSAVRQADSEVILRAYVAQQALEIKSAVIGMQFGATRIRLARDVPQLEQAEPILRSYQKEALEAIDRVLDSSPDAADTFKAIRSLVTGYGEIAGRIIGLQKQVLTLRAKQIELPDADIGSEIDFLANQQSAITRDKLNPLAEKVDSMIGKAAAALVDRMNESTMGSLNAMHETERLVLVIGGVVATLLIGAAIFGRFAIANPLRKIAAVLDSLTNDRIVDVPYAGRGDELGDIAKATEVFKRSVAEKVINLRVRSGLDVVRSSVMLADDHYNIIYVNSAFDQMMRECEQEIRKTMPGLDAAKLVGGSMDAFHKNPAHQRKLLDELSSMHEAQIAIGALKFHLVINPVMDAHGRRAGTVMEWRNVTAEKAIEAEVADIVSAAVAGDFSRRVPLDGKKEFMLKLAQAMNRLCETTGSALAEMATMLSALTRGDLTKRITADYEGMFGRLKADANAMADRLSATVSEIKASAREVTNAAAEISTSTTDLSQRTEEQAASLEETSASMEEMAATVKKNADNAQAANQSAAGTREVADRGGRVVADAVQAMARIEDSSRKISDIIGVIDEIARQTNLLALNAAVEAARAGDAGRGFAVVAAEVRTLAQRSSQAAKDIKDLITSSNGQVKEGVELVNRAGNSLTEIVQAINNVAQIVSDIATASIEQATGIEQVNRALTQMDEATQQNSALVEENAATAKTLETQAAAMSAQVAFFHLDEADVKAAAPAVPAPVARVAPAVKPQAPAVKRAAAPAPRRGAVASMQKAVATAFADPEWKDF